MVVTSINYSYENNVIVTTMVGYYKAMCVQVRICGSIADVICTYGGIRYATTTKAELFSNSTAKDFVSQIKLFENILYNLLPSSISPTETEKEITKETIMIGQLQQETDNWLRGI